MRVAKDLLLGCVLAAGAASCGSSPDPTVASSAIPDIGAYPPLPRGSPPGASRAALDAGAAIGRGVNFGNMLEAPTEGAWGLRVTDDFIDKAAAAGFTSVRLPVRWSNQASAVALYMIDAAFMARVDSIVGKLMARDLVVILKDAAKTWSASNRYPVFVGEFGAYSKADSTSRMTFNRTMRTAIETRGMTWDYWEFAAGFGVYDPVALQFRAGVLNSLLGS